jgi:hypothetical protein
MDKSLKDSLNFPSVINISKIILMWLLYYSVNSIASLLIDNINSSEVTSAVHFSSLPGAVIQLIFTEPDPD